MLKDEFIFRYFSPFFYSIFLHICTLCFFFLSFVSVIVILSFSVGTQFEPLSLESKAPATVVLLLSSQEEDILVKATEAIQKFAEKGRKHHRH